MRTTDDKKEYNLRIRLNEAMYQHLAKCSEKNDCSFSAYIRKLIEQDMETSA